MDDLHTNSKLSSINLNSSCWLTSKNIEQNFKQSCHSYIARGMFIFHRAKTDSTAGLVGLSKACFLRGQSVKKWLCQHNEANSFAPNSFSRKKHKGPECRRNKGQHFPSTKPLLSAMSAQLHPGSSHWPASLRPRRVIGPPKIEMGLMWVEIKTENHFSRPGGSRKEESTSEMHALYYFYSFDFSRPWSGMAFFQDILLFV